MINQTNIIASEAVFDSKFDLGLSSTYRDGIMEIEEPLNLWLNPNHQLIQLRDELSKGDSIILKTLSYKHWKLKKYGTDRLNWFSYVHYGCHRVLSKLKTTRRVYSWLYPKGPYLFSKAEALGRMVNCGFEIIKIDDTETHCSVELKAVSHSKKLYQPSTGLIFAMPRVRKGGKMIRIYKLRTMYPYSEYLPAYMVKAHGYSKSGKPADDFRVTRWGAFLRKYWLDEVPQLLNVLKGRVKIIGVRLVSKTYFDKIPQELKEMRLRHKPGVVPPYVSLNVGGNVEDVLAAEMTYLRDVEEKGFRGEKTYLLKALRVILTSRKTSA